MLRPSAKSTVNLIDRGLPIYNAGLVRKISQSTCVVKSESDDSHFYIVSSVGTCTCTDYAQRYMICKHAWSAYPGAAMTIWRLGMARTGLEVEQLAGLDLSGLPIGIARTVMLEAYRAIGRLHP